MDLKSRISFGYRLSDFIAASVAWILFFYYRKTVILPNTSFSEIWSDPNIYLGLTLIPLSWMLWFSLMGSYRALLHKSRLDVIYETFILVIIGSLSILLIILVDDDTLSYITYFHSFLVLVSLHAIVLLVVRMCWLAAISTWLDKGIMKMPTLIIGDNQTIDIDSLLKPHHNVIAHVQSIESGHDNVKFKKIEEVLFLPSNEVDKKKLFNALHLFEQDVRFKVPSDLASVIGESRILKFHSDSNYLLMEVDPMPYWQQHIKRFIDVTISALSLVLLSPLLLFSFYKIKRSSNGPIFFHQKRIGKYGEEFLIIKLRSMYVDAEAAGPSLSYEGDERCTAWGSLMRKYRIDEIPQFWNVIKGDMAIVGPRPERSYFIQQLKPYSDQLNRLLTVRPGITSWGQVKYGYASDIAEMLKRLRFDILYIENRSLFLDFKIMFYTLVVLIKGKGR